MKVHLVAVLLCLMTTVGTVYGMRETISSLVITDKGVSNYIIVVSENASPSEHHAAEELKHFLKEISDADLPIVTDKNDLKSYEIILGDNLHLEQLGIAIDFKALGSDGFTIQTQGDHLIIAGGRLRGTMYGVYTFLEDYLGCRWLHPQVSQIPKIQRVEVEAIHDTQIPSIKSRDMHYRSDSGKSDDTRQDADWAARNKINGHHARALEEKHGGKVLFAKPMYHSFYRLMPRGQHHGPQEYFKEHPEYYAEVKGKRVNEHGQLCLTNPDVVRISIETVKRWIREQPDKTIFTVSQNDYGNWCECDNCRAVDEQEESQMGTILQFVNQIAEAIEEENPDKLISTLAYAYGRKPPKNIRPRNNVVVRLAVIGLCYSHPLGTCDYPRRSPGAPVAVLEDMKKWSRIADRLFVWDYVINFRHWLMPQPNLYVLKPNMQFFVRHNVTEMFPQADPFNKMGEFSELRAYLLAKLMWNPDYDVDKGISEFLEAYYGQSAQPIHTYIDMLHNKVRDENIHMRHSVTTSPLFSPDVINRANALFDEAEQLADNEDILFRVKVARLSIQYLDLLKGSEGDPGRTLLVKDFFEIADKAGILYLGEGWGRDPYHMRTRKGNKFGKWSCPGCNKLFISFNSEGLETVRTAHETTWCPILNIAH